MGAADALGARHPEVHRLRRLLRRRGDRAAAGRLVVEGPHLVGEALAAGAPVLAVYVDAGAPVPAVAGSASAAGVPVRHLARGVLQRIADAVTPQPVLAEVAFAPGRLAEVLDRGATPSPAGGSGGAPFVVVCVGLADPGNAGTIVRTAEAAGAGAVVFAGAGVDPTNPKAVRASAGSLFHVPVCVEDDAAAALRALGAAGLRRFGTVATGGHDYDRAPLDGPVALVLGNEAHGLPPAVAGELDGLLTVPMAGRSESLNVGMAAAVLCFEVARRRRVAGAQADTATGSTRA